MSAGGTGGSVGGTCAATGGAGGGAGDSAGGSGGAAACVAGKTCIDPIPKGWIGPLAVHDTSAGGVAPGCTGYAPEGPVLHGALDASAASCACSCGAPENMHCGLAEIELFTNDACSGVPARAIGVWPGGRGSCSGHALPMAGYESMRLSSASVFIDGAGSCPPVAEADVEEATWGQTLTSCQPRGETVDCEGGRKLCLATPSPAFNYGLCIYANGDLPCPEGRFQRRLLRYWTFSDDRGCAECTCSIGGGSCVPDLLLSRLNDAHCLNGVHYGAVGECRTLGVPASDQGIHYSYDGEVVACTASAAEPVGRAVPAEPVTVCCASP